MSERRPLIHIVIQLKRSFDKFFSLGTSETSQHLDRSLLLEETGTPILMRRILYSFLLFTFIFLVWTALMQVNEVAICEGVVVPKGSLQEIQHLDGGVVSIIHIEEGDSVKAGTLLLELDDTDAFSQLSEENVRIEALQHRLDRLNLLLNPDGDLKIDLNSPIFQDRHLNTEQTSILKQSIATLAATREVVQSQISQLQVETEELAIQEKTLENQIAITRSQLDAHLKNGKKNIDKLNEEKESLQKEIDIRETLVDKGYNSNVKFLTIQREYLQLEKDILEKNNQYEEKLHSLKINLSELESQYSKTPLFIKKKLAKIDELGKSLNKDEAKIKESIYLEKDTLNEEMNSLKESSSRLMEIIKRKKIYAPVDGKVLKINPQRGSVLSPASLVLSLVPAGVKLIAELKILNHDIGHINLGDPVKLKFDSYDFSRYGILKGSLLEISPFTLKKDQDPSQQKGYYRGIVEMLQNHLGDHEHKNLIVPGMTLQAEIVTGKKTVMEYLLKPIYTSAQQALRER